MAALLKHVDTFVTRLVSWALVLLFAVMGTLAVVQVLLRIFLNNSILWADVAARSMVIWVGFLGGILAVSGNHHFHIDVLTRFLPPGGRLILHRLTNLFAATACYFMGTASITFVQLEPDARTFLDLPLNLVQAIIPAGFFLLMFRFALRIFLPDHDEPPSVHSASSEGA